MFRPGRNPKDQAQADDTADHTPHGSTGGSTSPYGGSSGSASGATGTSAGGGSSPSSDYYQAQTPTTTRAVTESESLARDIKEGTLTGFVGNGTSLTGEANFKGMLRVDGHLSGRVSSGDGTLIVSTNGQVDANVEVAVAQIYGTVNGDIVASKRIEMGRVAKVTGNIQTPALVIENGALFEGSCRMMQLKESAEKDDRNERSGVTSAAASSSGSSSGSSPSSTSTGSSGGSSSSSTSSGLGTSASKTSDVESASELPS